MMMNKNQEYILLKWDVAATDPNPYKPLAPVLKPVEVYVEVPADIIRRDGDKVIISMMQMSVVLQRLYDTLQID